MSATRWLSALLLVTLILSSAPAVSAAPAAAPVLQEPAAAGSTSYLLVVTPPKVSLSATAGALQAPGHVNMEHARHYSMIQARLEAWQKQGAIAGFSAEPAAYAFVVRGVTPSVLGELAALGRVQPAGDLSAAAVEGLSGAYQETLQAAIAAAAPPQFAAAPAAAPHNAAGGVPMAAAKPGITTADAQVATNVVNRNFHIQLNSSEVSGEIAGGILVTATLKTATGVVKGTAQSISYAQGVDLYLHDKYGNPVFVAATDILEVEIPTLITIPVVDLRALVNTTTRRATGVAPANVTARGSDSHPWLRFNIAQTEYITTTPSGTFDVSTTADSLPGRKWELRFANSESQDTFIEGEIPILVLRGEYENYWGNYDEDDARVSGAVLDANTVLTVTLTRAGSPPIVNYARSFEDGSFSVHLHDQYRNEVPILAGDTVQVVGGGVTLAATVPNFDIVSDPSTDIVTGTTNAVVVTDTINLTQTLAIFPNSTSDTIKVPDYAFGKLATVTGGSFSVGNNFYQWADPALGDRQLDWEPGAQGHLRYINADGNVIYAGFIARSVDPILALRGDSVHGYTFDNAVAGQTDVNGRGVISLVGADNALKARNFLESDPAIATEFRDVYGNPLPIADGDSVVATFADRTTTVKVPVFSITANAQTGVVTGRITGSLVATDTADAPQSLAVYPQVGSLANPLNVLTDANGDFRADFSSIVALPPGSEGYVKYVDANHNTVYAMWQVPFDSPALALRGHGGYVDENFVYIDLPIYAPEYACTRTVAVSVKAQDNTMRWQRTMAACTPGLAIDLTDGLGNPVNLNPGDTVQATFEGKSAVAVVPSFAVISDPKTSTVAGTTNATVITTLGLTQTLAVWPTTLGDANSGDYGKYVLVANSAFNATNPFYPGAVEGPDGVDLAWEPGAEGHLRYIDADGNLIYATFAAVSDHPVLQIQKGSNWVSGMTPVSSGQVTVTVKSGSTTKGIGTSNTDMGGMFDTQIFDGVGNPIRIAEGDVVEFTPPLTTVVVPPLTASIDVENDRISGKGPANAQLNFRFAHWYNSYDSMTVATDKDGNYTLDLRGLVDILPTMWGRLEYRNPDGQTIYIEQAAGTDLAGGLNTNRVWGLAPAGNTPVQVTVQRAGAVVGMHTVVADETGFFVAFPIDASGRPVIEQPGDVLTARYGSGGSRSFTLVPLQMTVDLAANTVHGAGPAASRLGVSVYFDIPIDHLDTTVLTDQNGQWSLDLTSWMLDLQAGEPVNVSYTANGADATWLGAVAPVFWVRSGAGLGGFAVNEETVVNNLVTGYAAPFAPVMVTLKRNGGVLAFASLKAGSWGYYMVYLSDRNGLVADIMPGDVVEVQSVAGPPVSVTVPVMTAVVDSFAGMITGTGPANAAMGVYWQRIGSRTVHTGADGKFAIPYTNITAAGFGSEAMILTYQEPQGNWIWASTGEPVVDPAYLEVRWDSNYVNYAYDGYLAHAVSGSAGAPLTQVQVALSRGGAVIAMGSVMSDQNGHFTAELRDSEGQPVDILGGDLVEMTAAAATRSLTVPDMTVQANLESLTLYGTGPANAPLVVYNGGCASGPQTAHSDEFAIDPSGNWVLSCPGLYHGDAGWIAVRDQQGNRTYLYWSVPLVEVRLNGNNVHGLLVPETQASVQLWRLNAKVAEAVVTTNEANGMFAAEFWGSGGTPFIILPNDTVVVAYGNQSITVPVVPMSFAVDNAADTVSGTGPARQELEVSVMSSGLAARQPENAWVDRLVTTGDDGAYVADFAGVRDIQGGDSVRVRYINVDGNFVYLYQAASLVRINLGSNIVDGYATPNSLASIVLKRGGDVIAATKAPTAMDGAFSAFFLDNDGNLIDLIAGDVVEVTASPTVISSAAGLTAFVDPTRDRISGSAPAGAAVLVVAYTCTGYCSSHPATAIAGADGSYAVDLAGIFDLDLTSYAYVQVIDGGGNMTSFTTTPSAVPQLADVENRLQAAGATVLASAFGTGNPGNLTPPMALTTVGPGKLIFVANGGTLVVTAPDGTIMRSVFGYLSVANPRTGRWLVQVQLADGPIFDNGTQYAMAAGQGLYTVYMPIVKQQTKK